MAKFGADTLRMYEMFIGPFDQMVAWNWEGAEGVYRFLKRTWNLVSNNLSNTRTSSLTGRTEVVKLISKVENDLENMKFNTAVAACMEFVNWWETRKR